MTTHLGSLHLMSFGVSCIILLLTSHHCSASTLRKRSDSGDGRIVHESGVGRTRHHSCGEGQYLKKVRNARPQCTNCTLCLNGQVEIRTCSRHRDTKCGGCIPGFYLNTFLAIPTCQRCRACPNQEIIRECTQTADRICGKCELGFFLDELTWQCVKCGYCWPEVPGYGISIPECIRPGQPRDRTCIASLPPPSLISPSSTERPLSEETSRRTTATIFDALDAKLAKLSQYMKQEVEDTRTELNILRERVKELDTS